MYLQTWWGGETKKNYSVNNYQYVLCAPYILFNRYIKCKVDLMCVCGLVVEQNLWGGVHCNYIHCGTHRIHNEWD